MPSFLDTYSVTYSDTYGAPVTGQLVQKAGSVTGTGATLTLTVGKDSGASIGGFASLAIGHMASLAVFAPGGVSVASVADSHGNPWQVDSPGSSTTGVRAGLASCILTTALALNDTVTITWSATPATSAGAALAEYSGVATAGGFAVTDPDGTATFHGNVATPTVATSAALGTPGELAISVCASSSAAGTFSITAVDADSGGTWTNLAYPAQPAQMDTAYQVAPEATTVQAAWSNSAGAPQNTDCLIVCYQPAVSLTITFTPPEGVVGTAFSSFPGIEGGTAPYTLALASGSGPLPPGLTLVAGGGTGPVGEFGCTYTNTTVGGPAAAMNAWIHGDGTNPGVERNPVFMKAFFPQSDGSGGGASFPASPGDGVTAAINAGRRVYLCYKPQWNTSLTHYDSTPGSATVGSGHGGTQADWIALKRSILAFQSNFPAHAARKCEVVLWHEIENKTLTPVQYWSMLAFYGSAVADALGAATGSSGHLWHISSAEAHGQLTNFFPANQGGGTTGPTAALVAGASTDCYTHSWLNDYRFDGREVPGSSAPTANSIHGLCIAAGIPFVGVTEFGQGEVFATGQQPSDTPLYIHYLAAYATAYPGTSFAWFGDNGKSGYGLIPGYASGVPAGTGFNGIPALRALADAIAGAGGGGGTPEVEGTPAAAGRWTVTLQATDHLGATATVTATIVIDPVPTPPPPPPAPVPSPRPKAWRFIIATPQPQGTWLAEIGQAQSRTVTFRSDPGQFHEASVDINGYDPVAELITPLQTDLQVVLDGTVLGIMRFGADQDTADATNWRYAPTAQDYREVLRRRDFAFGGGPNFVGVDVADVAWGMLKTGTNASGQTGIQAYPGGGLGISRGLGQDGLGVLRTINYIRQSFAGIELDNLAQMNPGGFDWDISPYGAADLRLDLWAPRRGTDRGVVLEWGGALVQSWTRSTDPSTYANSVFIAAQSGSAQTVIRPASNGGVLANIAHWSTPAPGVLAVSDTSNFPQSGVLTVQQFVVPDVQVTYTGVTSNQFTGCTPVGSPGGSTASAGGGVLEQSPDAVQLDAPDIATRPEGRWDQVAGTGSGSTQNQLDGSAAFDLAEAEVITPAYQLTLYPGVWEGPGHIWIGDLVTVRIKAGRLAVNDQLRVTEMAFSISADNVETLVLTVGRVPFRLNRAIPQIFRRLRSLETL